ncbi:MAG: heme exporter protein CcmB [Bacteroidota bacterium]
MKGVIALIAKDIRLEWRQRYALNGMLLYIAGTVLAAYTAFGNGREVLPAPAWNALLWVILLFTAVTAVARSFDRERAGRFIYMYTLVSPQQVIAAKIIYNCLLMPLLTFAGFGVYSLVLGCPVQDMGLFITNLLMGAIGFSSTLTLVAAIADRAAGNAMLMPILSLPIMIPMLLMLIGVSKNAVDGLDFDLSVQSMLTQAALNAIVVTVSYLLFPYLWRS